MFSCVNDISLDRLRKSSLIFGCLRKSSGIFGNFRLAFGQILENLRKVVGSIRKIAKNVVMYCENVMIKRKIHGR